MVLSEPEVEQARRVPDITHHFQEEGLGYVKSQFTLLGMRDPEISYYVDGGGDCDEYQTPRAYLEAARSNWNTHLAEVKAHTAEDQGQTREPVDSIQFCQSRLGKMEELIRQLQVSQTGGVIEFFQEVRDRRTNWLARELAELQFRHEHGEQRELLFDQEGLISRSADAVIDWAHEALALDNFVQLLTKK